MVSVDPKVVVCVFAHPDDEAFGPGGTIAKFARNIPVHVICITDGNADGNGTLAATRRSELMASAKVLGVTSVEFLGYADGTLNNEQYHRLAKDIKKHIVRLQPDTLLTFDINGVSGHLDHIAVAMVTSYLYEKSGFIKTLMYFCEGEDMKKILSDYFVYVPPGYCQEDIDYTMDVTDVFEQKVRAMREHVSQKKDCDFLIEKFGDLRKQELFRIVRR